MKNIHPITHRFKILPKIEKFYFEGSYDLKYDPNTKTNALTYVSGVVCML